jgi:hypothetical protein
MGNARQDIDLRLASWLRGSDAGYSHVPATADAWTDLAHRAAKEGLAGLLLEKTTECGIELPAYVREQLRNAAMKIAAANLHAKSELARLLPAFETSGVPVMLLKGAALNLTVYPRPDLRPTSDVDLLIHPANVGVALSGLADSDCHRGFDLIRDDFFPKYHYELELFTASPAPLRIDLHVRPLRPLRVSRTMPDDALWERARSVKIEDATAEIPTPEMMFLHLAAHAAYHGCSRLLWLFDLKRMAEFYGDLMDWELIVERARHWRLSWPLLRAIQRATELFGPVCPPRVIGELAGHLITWRDRLALAHAPRDASSPVSHVVVDLLCTPGIRFRMGYLLSFLLPGRKHLATIYPRRHRGWSICAHFWRVGRLFRRALAGPLKWLVAASPSDRWRTVQPNESPGVGR